jgi:uncharacterized membrane protein YhdT
MENVGERMSQTRETETEQSAERMSLLDEYQLERDPRFKRAKKEAKVVLAYMCVSISYYTIVSYWGALTYDPEGPGIILGMPWYFLLELSGAVVFMIIGAYIGLYYIEDTELSAWEER